MRSEWATTISTKHDDTILFAHLYCLKGSGKFNYECTCIFVKVIFFYFQQVNVMRLVGINRNFIKWKNRNHLYFIENHLDSKKSIFTVFTSIRAFFPILMYILIRCTQLNFFNWRFSSVIQRFKHFSWINDVCKEKRRKCQN